ILALEPKPLRSLNPDAPLPVERMVQHGLEKDPAERFQNAHDLKLEMQLISEMPVTDPEGAASLPAKRRWLPWAVAGIGVLAAITLGLLFTQAGSRHEVVVRSSILPPEKSQFTLLGMEPGPIVVSPDGRRIAFSAQDQQGKTVLWVRALDSLSAQPLAGTDSGSFPFWSPDSQYLGFFAD